MVTIVIDFGHSKVGYRPMHENLIYVAPERAPAASSLKIAAVWAVAAESASQWLGMYPCGQLDTYDGKPANLDCESNLSGAHP
jgi:hypothetical protein